MKDKDMSPKPRTFYIPIDRRRFFKSMAVATAGFTGAGSLAEALTLTPEQTPGPFYPDSIPLDKDNDLLFLNDNLTPAVGTITYVSGRVLDGSGNPIRGALVELWQTDNNGAYIHTLGAGGRPRDP